MAENGTDLIETYPSTPGDRGALAPWWQTALLVLLILGTSILGTRHSQHRGLAGRHFGTYLFTLGWEWFLAAFAYWGLWLKKVSIATVVGEWRRDARGWVRDIGRALVFWIMAMTVLAAVSVLLRLAHMENAQKKIAELAPSSWLELALWILLSMSAGFCEEFLFRGYLQQQFSRVSGRGWIGVLGSALLFGAAHGYEGMSGMIAITLFGAMFSVLAIKTRGLRTGMLAHAWHDSFVGALLALAKLMHLL